MDAIDSSYAFVEFDIKGNVITTNENFLKTMEYSLDEIKGKHHRMFVDRSFLNTNDMQDSGKTYPWGNRRLTITGESRVSAERFGYRQLILR